MRRSARLDDTLSLVHQSSNLLPVPVSQQNPKRRRLMSPGLSHILEEVQRELGLLEIDDEQMLRRGQEIEELIAKTALRLGFELTAFERDDILSELERNQRPFGLLQELVDNQEISDIIVTDYSKISFQQNRKTYQTDLSFPNQQSYETYVERLLQKAGTTYSTKKPIADGMIGDLARLHVVHQCLCQTGPYMTIRLNRFSRVTMKDLEFKGLAPRPILDYLEGLITAGLTVLLVGEVGTGKTTLARALAGSIPAEESILVIEDTPEIQLEHPQVRYVQTREANSDGAGRVTPSECIRAGMRMAMNRIIFGEMRDAEAAEAFIDVCASGHPGLSTIHARSASEAVARLELFLGRAQRGASRNVFIEQIATAVQVIVYIDICHKTSRRRIMEVKEIGPVADGVMRQRDIFKYDNNSVLPQWKVITKVSAHKDALERLESPVRLQDLSQYLELSESVRLREMV